MRFCLDVIAPFGVGLLLEQLRGVPCELRAIRRLDPGDGCGDLLIEAWLIAARTLLSIRSANSRSSTGVGGISLPSPNSAIFWSSQSISCGVVIAFSSTRLVCSQSSQSGRRHRIP